jgi:hypothetical protein
MRIRSRALYPCRSYFIHSFRLILKIHNLIN